MSGHSYFRKCSEKTEFLCVRHLYIILTPEKQKNMIIYCLLKYKQLEAFK